MPVVKESVCIIGLGYVGLPLAECFVNAGFRVVGYDADAARIAELRGGRDSGGEVSGARLAALLPKLTLSTDIADAEECTAYLIAVPTPLDNVNKPDLSHLRAACQTISGVLRRGDMVVVESTVYPGVTEDVCAPILARVSGLRYNDDFVCGYSPERLSPGDKTRGVADIVKVTAGSTPAAAKRVDNLYRAAITAGTTPASSIRVAEAAKAVENTQRDVNIALMNELAMLLESAGLDSGEVFAAARSKWNFLPFAPGLVGGHCIGVDPYYLLHKAKSCGYSPNLILAARQINDGMGEHIARVVLRLMMRRGIIIKGASVLIFGFTFKENCPDCRNSRVFDLHRALAEVGCDIRVCDPVADVAKVQADYGIKLQTDINAELAKKPAAIIFAVAHDCFGTIGSGQLQDALVVDVKGIAPRSDWRL